MRVRGIFCDISKAFDCITPEMLAKLHFYKIWGVSEDWFSSCVTSRRQKAEVTSPNTTRNVFSDWGRLQCGVLQGSFLGHLFIIYINDLLLRIYSVPEPVLFAEHLGVLYQAEISKIFVQCQI